MNRTPTYTELNFQNEDDLSFGLFDIPSATSHTSFYQGMQAERYTDSFALHGHTPPSGHLPYQNPSFEFLQRDLIPTYDEHTQPSTPYPLHPKFEPPSLSSGSSSTPENNESHRLVTPKNIPAMRQASDECEDGVEDVDDPIPLLGPARKRLAKQKTKENVEGKEKEGKRRHFLQRNRVAAMKCRKKKKEWVNDLEETKSGLESQNTHLHMELDGLVDEASRIRAQLMLHANCNDSNIDKWIENEAKRFVIGTGERYDQILAHFSPSQSIGNNHQESMPSSCEYSAAGAPNLISPLVAPSQLPPASHTGQPAPSSAFFATSIPTLGTPGCYTSQETASFEPCLEQTQAADREPDYDGMSISLYEHPVS